MIDVLSKNISTTCVSYCKQLRYANQCWQKNHVTQQLSITSAAQNAPIGNKIQ